MNGTTIRILFFLVLMFHVMRSRGENDAQKTYTCTIDFTRDNASYDEELEKIPCPFTISSLAFESEIALDSAEMSYLAGISEGDVLTLEMLKKLCLLLEKKNKFSAVTIVVGQDGEGKRHLSFSCKVLWTFKALKLSGVLRDAEHYRQYYLIEPGEIFDYAKHQFALKKYKEVLHAEGFLHATMHDYFKFDPILKTVTVHLAFSRGEQCVIKKVSCDLIVKEVHDKQRTRLLKTKIMHHLEALTHTYYSHKLLNEHIALLKKFLVQKGFLQAKIVLKEHTNQDDASVHLQFILYLSPKKNFVFFGNQFFSHQDFLNILLAFGRSAELLPDALISDEIMSMYLKKGFKSVDIEVKNDAHKRFFLIKEGPRFKVGTFKLKGSQFPHNIHALIKRRFKKEKFYDDDRVELMHDEIVAWYRKKGFWDAIASVQETVDKEKNAVHFLITVNEGKRRIIHSMTFDDTFIVGETLKQEIMHSLVPHSSFDVRTLQEWQKTLQNDYYKKGMLHTKVVPELNDHDGLLDITWTTTGDNHVVTFGKVIIQGDTSFPFENIKRELVFCQGDVWSQDKLEKSLQNLKRLNLFEKINFYPALDNADMCERDVILQLIDDDRFEVRTRVGFQQVSRNITLFHKGSTYKLGGEFLYRNPGNVGDSFAIDTDFTRYYRNVSVVYQRPWIFSQPILTVLKGYSNKYIQPIFIGSNKPLYLAIQQGFLLGLSRSWTHCDLGVQTGIELMETKHISIPRARAINFDPFLINKNVPYVYVEPNIVIDYLDNDVNPTQGSLTALSLRAMVPTNHHVPYYVKVLCEQTLFFPLNPFVLALRLRFGHIFNQEFPTIMPPERFYLGGQNSIRSYEANQGPPLGVYISKKGKKKFVPQGGKSMVNGNVECRFPLIGKLGGVVFQDMGILVEKSLTQILGSHFLTAIGFGLRYYSPVGPLRFDIGWKWRKFIPEESSFAWFLTFGHPF